MVYVMSNTQKHHIVLNVGKKHIKSLLKLTVLVDEEI